MAKEKNRQDLRTATTVADEQDQKVIESFSAKINGALPSVRSVNNMSFMEIDKGNDAPDKLIIRPDSIFDAELIYAASVDAGFLAQLIKSPASGYTTVELTCTDLLVDAAVEEQSGTMNEFKTLLANKKRMYDLNGFIGTKKGETVEEQENISAYCAAVAVENASSTFEQQLAILQSFPKLEDAANRIKIIMARLGVEHSDKNPDQLQELITKIDRQDGLSHERDVLKTCLGSRTKYRPALAEIFPEAVVEVEQAELSKTSEKVVQ